MFLTVKAKRLRREIDLKKWIHKLWTYLSLESPLVVLKSNVSNINKAHWHWKQKYEYLMDLFWIVNDDINTQPCKDMAAFDPFFKTACVLYNPIVSGIYSSSLSMKRSDCSVYLLFAVLQCWRCCSLGGMPLWQNRGWQDRNLWCELQNWEQMLTKLKASSNATKPLRSWQLLGRNALCSWRDSQQYAFFFRFLQIWLIVLCGF